VRNVLGCVSFLTVLRTHRISRSLPLIPQRIPASPAVVPAAAGPAPHARPAASKHHTHMQHAAPCIACGSREYSGRVLLSDVPSPPHEVPTQADGEIQLPDAIRQRPASDPGAAPRAEAEPMGRSVASQLATVTRRSLQPPSCPPAERHRAGRDPPMKGTHRGSPASDPGAAARAEAEPMERSAASQLATVTRRSLQPPSCPPSERHLISVQIDHS
jgi:hypothetical protein